MDGWTDPPPLGNMFTFCSFLFPLQYPFQAGRMPLYYYTRTKVCSRYSIVQQSELRLVLNLIWGA